MLRNHVLPALGELRMHEVTVPRLDPFFVAVQQKSSAAHARTARAVVGGVVRYAIRNGASAQNPVRDVEPIEGGTRKEPRALTLAERREWLALLEQNPIAVEKDLPDLVRFMLGTGVRIGGAMALLWREIDLAAGVAQINATLVRVRGVGLVRKPPKSRAGLRTLPLPAWLVETLKRRTHGGDDQPVFPDSLGGFRDPSNTRRVLRDARGADRFAWVTSHVFRKTAATIMDEAGLSGRAVADHLGHAKPSMTQDTYLGRKVLNPAAAKALDSGLSGTEGFSGSFPGLGPTDDAPTTR